MTLNQILKSPLKTYILENKKTFFAGMFFLVLTNALDASYPLIIKNAIDSFSEIQNNSFQETLKWGGLFFIVLSLLAVTRYYWRVYFGAYHTRAAEDLRQRLFNHLSQMDPLFYSKEPTGEVVSLIINDIQAFRQAIGHAVLVITDGLLIAIFIIPTMWKLNADWMFKTLIFIPVLPFLIKYIMTQINLNFKLQQKRLAELSNFTQETLSGIKIIKSFANESRRLNLFRGYNDKLLEISQKIAFFDASFGPSMELAVTIGSAILIFIAAPDLMSGQVTVGTFIAYQRYITKMVWPMTALGIGFSQYQKGMTSFKRIKEVFAQSNPILSGPNALNKIESLVINNLSFSYTDKNPALQNVSLKMLDKSKIGLLGPVGSGKSTLTHLMLRLYSLQEGQILINNQDFSTYSIDDLRARIRLLTQEPLLFSMSVRENLKLSSSLSTDEDIWKSLEVAEIKNEILSLPQGLDTLVGEKGVNFSGGQKQRLCLARAILSKPNFLILDDPLSAVDVHTEKLIIEHLSMLDINLVIISHRLSVLKNCEKIYVIHNHKIQAEGTIEQLLQSSPLFKEIYKLQKESL